MAKLKEVIHESAFKKGSGPLVDLHVHVVVFQYSVSLKDSQ